MSERCCMLSNCFKFVDTTSKRGERIRRKWPLNEEEKGKTSVDSAATYGGLTDGDECNEGTQNEDINNAILDDLHIIHVLSL